MRDSQLMGLSHRRLDTSGSLWRLILETLREQFKTLHGLFETDPSSPCGVRGFLKQFDYSNNLRRVLLSVRVVL